MNKFLDVPLPFEINKDDIAYGEAQDCGKCPMARAFNRLFGVDDTRVYHQEACTSAVGYFILPQVFTYFLREFDSAEYASAKPSPFNCRVIINSKTKEMSIFEN